MPSSEDHSLVYVSLERIKPAHTLVQLPGRSYSVSINIPQSSDIMLRIMRCRILAALFSIATAIGASTAWAYSCQGTLDSINLNPGGVITVGSVQSGLGTFYVCQIGATTNGVGPDVCNSILASLIAAKESGEQVQWQFNDSLTCTTHPQWAWLTGWYYGPSLL